MDYPKIGPFTVHGFIPEGETEHQVYGICPFCGKSKFYVNHTTGQWDCKGGSCGRQGNTYSFLQQYWEFHFKATKLTNYKSLMENRGLKISTLRDFAQMAFDGSRWLLPIRREDGTIVQLRNCQLGKPLMNTKGIGIALYGVHTFSGKKKHDNNIWLCEGEWDVMAMHELMVSAGEDGVALGAPGASTWKKEWGLVLNGKDVKVCYDNDTAGQSGSDKLEETLKDVASKVEILHWPESLPEHYDIRDFLSDGGTIPDLKKLFLNKVENSRVVVKKKSTKRITLEETLKEYEKWLCLSPEIVDAIKLAFATTVSNRIAGDPVWLFIVAPPGGCKTEILMSLHSCPECIVKSTLTPHSLVSGFRTPDGKDPSLIPQLNGKVFVLKDFTEVQEMNHTARDEVYSVLRGAYDGIVEKDFGNGIKRKYEPCHFSMLAGTTHHIQAERRTALGERFIMYRMRDSAIAASVSIRAAMSNVGEEGAMRTELQTAARDFLEQDFKIEAKLSPRDIDKIVALAQLCGLLRGQVTKDFRGEIIQYRPESEVGTRLAKQLKKLAISLQSLTGGTTLNRDTMRIVERVALDTSTDFDASIYKTVGASGKEGLTVQELVDKLGIPKTTLKDKVDDMELMGVLRHDRYSNEAGRGAPVYKYVLTQRSKSLWDILNEE